MIRHEPIEKLGKEIDFKTNWHVYFRLVRFTVIIIPKIENIYPSIKVKNPCCTLSL